MRADYNAQASSLAMLSYNPFTVATTFLPAPARRQLRTQLLRWFDHEKRSLPWRGQKDPYRILVSEVMLQQTRVAVVVERYQKFLRQFPDVSRLARAKAESVLAAWSGLGYYRRARALHAAARHVQSNGGFPASAAKLAQLPGIGRYTAAAVASIAFDEPAAVVDGNVKRVLQRLSGLELSSNDQWQMAQGLLDLRRPGDFNQAMMELGATICLPGQPICTRCPAVKFCASRGTSNAKKIPALRRKATLRYILARRGDAIFLKRRPASVSLMPGMWELPQDKRPQTTREVPVLRLRHSITTTDYNILVHANGRKRLSEGAWFPLRTVARLPLTGLARKILRRLELIA